MAKIILAEDDSDMRRFLVKALQNAGFEVTSYDNGLSAYQRLREEPFELLLTDIVSPSGVNGFALGRMARVRRNDLKIVYMTAYEVPENEALGKVLRKPLTDEQLVAEIREALAA